jgi:hypothetical protein
LRKLILMAIALGALAVPAVASAAPAKTTLVFDGVFLGNGQSFWDGDIVSAKKACMNKRTVDIYRVRPGADKKIGSTKSHKGLAAPTYHWDFSARIAAKPGKYYAVVKATTKCGGDRSNVLKGPQ